MPLNTIDFKTDFKFKETAYILYMDVVGSALLTMDAQRAIYEELTALVRQTPEFCRAEASAQVLSRPTGDGMALVFFTSPDAPLHCALELATALKRHPHILLRMGVHGGDVYRVQDINASDDVTGDGIIMAQRIMDCGDAGHILVSSVLAESLDKTPTWRDFLHFAGICEIKHGRRIAVWNLFNDAVGNSRLPRRMVDQVAFNTIAEDVPKPKVNGAKARKILAAYLLILAGGYLHFFLSYLLPPQAILIGAVVLLLIGLIPYVLLLSIKNDEPK